MEGENLYLKSKYKILVKKYLKKLKTKEDIFEYLKAAKNYYLPDDISAVHKKQLEQLLKDEIWFPTTD